VSGGLPAVTGRERLVDAAILNTVSCPCAIVAPASTSPSSSLEGTTNIFFHDNRQRSQLSRSVEWP